jgi:preprotein translocase subunit SecY
MLNKTLNKVLITLAVIFIIRVGNYIPIPNIEPEYLSSIMSSTPLLRNNYLDENIGLGILSLSILPNLNASILVQILIKVIPKLKNIQKEEGERGRKKITLLIRSVTFIIALIESWLITVELKPAIFDWSFSTCSQIILSLVTGSMVVLWLSEIITEKGVGNGPTIILITNILTGLPITIARFGSKDITVLPRLLGLILLIMILFWVEEAISKIPLITAKQLSVKDESVKKNIKDNSFLPLKINQTGIMPIAFASIMVNVFGFVAISATSALNIKNLVTNPQVTSFSYSTVNFILVILFSGLYANLIIDSRDIAKDLNKSSITIPKITPGVETKKFLERRFIRLANIGGIFLATISSIPNINSFAMISVPSLIILIGGIVEINRQIKTLSIAKVYETK